MNQNSMYKFSELCDVYTIGKKRSEGRFKNYISNVDIRSWSASKNERREFFQEFITNPEIFSNEFGDIYLPSAIALAGALLAKKNSDIRKLTAALAANGIDVDEVLEVPHQPASGAEQAEDEATAYIPEEESIEELVPLEDYEAPESTEVEQEPEDSTRSSSTRSEQLEEKSEELEDTPQQPSIENEEQPDDFEEQPTTEFDTPLEGQATDSSSTDKKEPEEQLRQPSIESDQQLDYIEKQPSVEIESPIESQERDSPSTSEQQPEEQKRKSSVKVEPPPEELKRKSLAKVEPPPEEPKRKSSAKVEPPPEEPKRKSSAKVEPPPEEPKRKSSAKVEPPPEEPKRKSSAKVEPPPEELKRKSSAKVEPPPEELKRKSSAKVEPPPEEPKRKSSAKVELPPEELKRKSSAKVEPPPKELKRKSSEKVEPPPEEQKRLPSTDIEQQLKDERRLTPKSEESLKGTFQQPETSDVPKMADESQPVSEEVKTIESISENSKICEQVLQEIRKSMAESSQQNEQALEDIRKTIEESSQLNEQALEDIRQSIKEISLLNDQTLDDIRKSIAESLQKREQTPQDIKRQPSTTSQTHSEKEETPQDIQRQPSTTSQSHSETEETPQDIQRQPSTTSQSHTETEETPQDIQRQPSTTSQTHSEKEQTQEDIKRQPSTTSQTHSEKEQTQEDIKRQPSTTSETYSEKGVEPQASTKSEHEIEGVESYISLKSIETTADDEIYPTTSEDVREDYVRYPSVESEKELEDFARPLSMSEETSEKDIRQPSTFDELDVKDEVEYHSAVEEDETEEKPPSTLPGQEYEKTPDLDLQSRIDSLEKENEELHRIISDMELERDNLRNDVMSLEEMTKSLQKEDAEKHQKPDGDGDMKGDLMIKDLIASKENDSEFLKEHISKLQLFMDTIACISKERDSLKNYAKKCECIEQEISKLKQQNCELERDLEEADDEIEDLEKDLKDSKCVEKTLREQLCQCQQKLNAERRRSTDFENSVSGNSQRADALKRERDKMAEAMKSLEDELARMKKKEEEENARWKKAMAELENTVKDHESEKHRMSVTLQKMIDDELITLEREAERQELCNLRRTSVANENLIEKFKQEMEISKSTYDTDVSHLRESLSSKDGDLQKMITEIEKLKELVKSLENKRHTLEQLVGHQKREIDELKDKLDVKSKIEQGNMDLSVEDMEIKIDYGDKNNSSYVLKASSSEMKNTEKPSTREKMLSIPVKLGPCAEKGLLNKKIYEANICNQAFISRFNCLTKSQNTQAVKFEIWESEKIILPKCI